MLKKILNMGFSFSSLGKGREEPSTLVADLDEAFANISPEDAAFVVQEIARMRANALKAGTPVTATLDSITKQYERDDKLTFPKIEKMINDEQIHSARRTIELGLTAYPWGYLNPDPAIQEFVMDASNACHGGRAGLIRELLYALDYGFTVSEREMAYNTVHKKIFIPRIKTLRHANVTFNTNAKGTDIDWFGQPVHYEQPDGSETDVDANRLMIWTYQAKYGDPYGIPALKPCYRAWFIKKALLMAWATSCERHGAPWVTAESPDGNETFMRRVLNALRSITTDSVVVTPPGVKTNITQPNFSSETFSSYVAYLDRLIFRVYTMPSLVLGEGEGKGSYALGKTHFDLFLWNQLDLRNQLAEVLLKQWVAPLVFTNFGDKAPLGKVVWPRMKGESLAGLLEVYARFANKGLLTYPDLEVTNLFREALDLSPMTEERLPEALEKYYEYLRLQAEASAITSEPKSRAEEARESRPVSLSIAEPLESFAVTPQEVEKTMDSDTDRMSARIRKVYDSVELNRPTPAQIRDIKSYENNLDPDEAAVETLAYKVAVRAFPARRFEASFQAAIEAPMGFAATHGVRDASKQITDLKRKKKDENQDAPAIDISDIDVYPEDAVEAYTVQYAEFKTKQEIYAMSNTIKRYIGDLGTGEKTFDITSFMETLNKSLDLSKSRSETIAQTEVTRGYNLGRLHRYNDDPDFISGYRFSAILDKRTTPYCRDIDGKQIQRSEMREERLPPFHFSCRTIIEPVTEFSERQDFDVVPEPPEDFRGEVQ